MAGIVAGGFIFLICATGVVWLAVLSLKRRSVDKVGVLVSGYDGFGEVLPQTPAVLLAGASIGRGVRGGGDGILNPSLDRDRARSLNNKTPPAFQLEAVISADGNSKHMLMNMAQCSFINTYPRSNTTRSYGLHVS